MNIYELGKKSGLPLKTLRMLDKLGALKVEADTGPLSAMIFHMKGNMFFTTGMLLQLLDNPALVGELAYVSPRYERRARAQIDELGDVAASHAPKSVTAEIAQAAKGDDDAALVIAQWLMAALPSDPVPHHWAAIRLLAPLNEFLREQNGRLISLALLNVRKLPEFAPYWRSEKVGTRNQVKYFRPELDL